MDDEIKLTIVQNPRQLNHYPIQRMDKHIHQLLSNSIPRHSKSNHSNIIVNLFDCYLGVTKQWLDQFSLYDDEFNFVVKGFVGAILSDKFIAVSPITRSSYRLALERALKKISVEHSSVNYIFIESESLEIWNSYKLDETEIEYYKGWEVSDKRGRSQQIKLAWVWNNYGGQLASKVHLSAKNYLAGYSSLRNFVPTLNSFCQFAEEYFDPDYLNKVDAASFSTDLIDRFCEYFFRTRVDDGICLDTTIKRWNDSRDFIHSALFESGLLLHHIGQFHIFLLKESAEVKRKLPSNLMGLVLKIIY